MVDEPLGRIEVDAVKQSSKDGQRDAEQSLPQRWKSVDESEGIFIGRLRLLVGLIIEQIRGLSVDGMTVLLVLITFGA